MVIGYTTGVFDLFHIGHLNILRSAKGLCDKLIVGVSTDELVLEYKQKKPVIPYVERIELVRSNKYVDIAVSQDSMDKFEAWRRIKFNIMFVGDDWYGTEKWNNISQQFQNVGVKVCFLPYTKGTSSTLVNEVLMTIVLDANSDSVSSKP